MYYVVQLQQPDLSWAPVSQHTLVEDAERQLVLMANNGAAGPFKLGLQADDGTVTDLNA